jgi:sulfur relay (sulfurtransferase) complex TusBCD TusD component (DsrE family)
MEEAEGAVVRLCLDCALKRGYAHPKTEKGEEVMSFFPEPKYGQ